MGTLLYARGVSLDACFDVLNLNAPKMVQGIHAEYIAAGADCIQTNTFGANRFKLRRARHGRRACARSTCAGPSSRATCARAWGGTSSCSARSARWASTWPRSAPSSPRRRARRSASRRRGSLEGGVDGFVVETFSDLVEVRLAVEAVRAITDLPVVATLAFTEDARDLPRPQPGEVARALRDLPVQAVGANCSVGSSVLYDVARAHAAGGGRAYRWSSSPTPACRAAWASGSCICPRRPTWRTMRRA